MTSNQSLVWRIAFVLAVLGAASLFFTLHVSTTPPPAPDYDDGSAWLCRPGRDDACAKPTTATVLQSGNTKKVETYKPNPLAAVDCFYLYPTVSRVHAAYSPIEITPDETRIVREQLARFGAVCRPFAPLYRQVTIAGLPGLFRGDHAINLHEPYKDVTAAWKNYLAKDNDGRAVVLIGHSQGARLLAKLMADEIDGKPIQSRLVAAILPGTEIDVPPGRTVGSTFEHISLCDAKVEIGCIISYASFPADRPMAPNARLGAPDVAGSEFACVNPAALVGSPTLGADLPVDSNLQEKLGTDFVELPGLISAKCKRTGRFNVLAISTDPEVRMGEKPGALVDRLADYSPAMGLHTLDINLALGNLVEIVRQKAASFSRH